MIKITLFVFAVLLVAVVFAAPKPEGEEKPTSDPADPLKLLNEAVQTVFSKDNMDKLKETFNVEQLQKAFEKGHEQVQDWLKDVKKTTENSN